MLPTISILNHTIAMYGFMILIGIISGTLVSIRLSKRNSIKSEDVIFSIIYGVLGIIVGAKLLYIIIEIPWIIQNMSALMQNPVLIKELFTGGFVFYGGLIGGFLMVLFYCFQYHISFAHITSVVVPAIPLAHAFGRIGCYFAGCCFGIPYEGFFHIVFINSQIAPNNIALFPTQLFECFINLLIFLAVFFYATKNLGSFKVLAFYLLLYSIMRFFMEFLRGDTERGISLGLSTSQWISIVLFLLSLVIYRKSANLGKNS